MPFLLPIIPHRFVNSNPNNEAFETTTHKGFESTQKATTQCVRGVQGGLHERHLTHYGAVPLLLPPLERDVRKRFGASFVLSRSGCAHLTLQLQQRVVDPVTVSIYTHSNHENMAVRQARHDVAASCVSGPHKIAQMSTNVQCV